jgi:transmembrane sensor
LNKQELYELIDKYLSGEANEEEIDRLSRYYNSFQQSSNWNESELGALGEMESKLFEGILQKIEANEEEELVAGDSEMAPEEKVVYLSPKRKLFSFVRIAAAACIIGVLALSAFLWLGHGENKEIAQGKSNNSSITNAAPGGDKAILKLADGSTVVLDDAQNGALAQQGNTKVIKLNGKINYNATSKTNEVLYNTISTPRGGKYQVELADGSQAWLNAASSLRFPTAFTGKERRVEITGEAYFEVAKNKAMPFVVSLNGAEVQVLGTHFNVMAYSDEAAFKTTLLEGAVKFVRNDVSSILKPGQQAQLSKTGKVKVVDGVDLDEVIAWKNGMFNFQGVDIGTIARQLSRWYEVDIDYDHTIDDLFYAKVPRSTKLSEVLRLLELTGKVHFQIDGRKIIAKP